MMTTIAFGLGFISAISGFVAEATKIKISKILVDSNNVCYYPSSPAFALGLISILALLVAFIVINFYCYKANGCRCNGTLVCFIFSWLTFVPGLLLLLMGTSESRNLNTRAVRGQYNDNCSYVKPGLFASGASLSLITIALGITYYSSIASAQNGPYQPNDDIAMGQRNVHSRIP